MFANLPEARLEVEEAEPIREWERGERREAEEGVVEPPY